MRNSHSTRSILSLINHWQLSIKRHYSNSINSYSFYHTFLHHKRNGGVLSRLPNITQSETRHYGRMLNRRINKRRAKSRGNRRRGKNRALHPRARFSRPYEWQIRAPRPPLAGPHGCLRLSEEEEEEVGHLSEYNELE